MPEAKQNARADQSRIIRDLREMRDIARREHGPEARSTRHIQEARGKAEREHEGWARAQAAKKTEPWG